MHIAFSVIGGAGFGAGLMFVLDPERGRRRQALMREKSLRWSRKTRELAGTTSHDVRSSAKGMGTAVKSWVEQGSSVPDRIVAERVRSKLGMYSRHPSAIDAHVTDGVVTLSGPVLKDEVDSICRAIARIPGVMRVSSDLEPHESPDDVPALQGPINPRHGSGFPLMQHWSPAARLAAALLGTVALLYGLSQRTAGAATLAASGLGLLIRSVTNQEFASLLDFTEQFEKTA